jgi:hypothetical protein
MTSKTRNKQIEKSESAELHAPTPARCDTEELRPILPAHRPQPRWN